MPPPPAGTGLRLSVIIPAFNEAATLPTVVHEVLALPLDLEVIVIDDGSRDRTGCVARELERRNARVRLIAHARNRGKGAAVRTGLRAARGAVVVIQDADLEYEPRDIVRMLARLEESGADAVYGSRWLLAGNRAASPAHRLGNRFLAWLVRTLYRVPLTDEATAYKMGRRSVLLGLLLRESGFGFCAEVTAKLLRAGSRIEEVPVSYCPRSAREGKKIRFRHALEATWLLLRYRFAAPARHVCEVGRPVAAENNSAVLRPLEVCR